LMVYSTYQDLKKSQEGKIPFIRSRQDFSTGSGFSLGTVPIIDLNFNLYNWLRIITMENKVPSAINTM